MSWFFAWLSHPWGWAGQSDLKKQIVQVKLRSYLQMKDNCLCEITCSVKTLNFIWKHESRCFMSQSHSSISWASSTGMLFQKWHGWQRTGRVLLSLSWVFPCPPPPPPAAGAVPSAPPGPPPGPEPGGASSAFWAREKMPEEKHWECPRDVVRQELGGGGGLAIWLCSLFFFWLLTDPVPRSRLSEHSTTAEKSTEWRW